MTTAYAIKLVLLQSIRNAQLFLDVLSVVLTSRMNAKDAGTLITLKGELAESGLNGKQRTIGFSK